jgi:hypothetical protein
MAYADQAAQRDYQRQWLASRRSEWLAAHGPCVDCRTWDRLQVDHVDAATKVTHRVWSWAKVRREAELAKCVVRCEPCHFRKTTEAGERAHGSRNGKAKLTEQTVREVFAASGSHRIIAERYGVSYNLVGRIKRREVWRHLALPATL